MQRVFLGWERPALPAAADWLLRHFGAGSAVSWENLLIVVPGGRAGRRLLELLVAHAESEGRALTAPRIVTLGELPEHLYAHKRPFADELVQSLAWVETLRQSDPKLLWTVIPHPPEPADQQAWMALADMLARLHRELAADDLDFEAVASRVGGMDGFRDHRRWESLATIQKSYLAMLDSLGLWDKQTARLYALEHGEVRSDRRIVLLATVDMNRTQRAMLDQAGDLVTALIVAPESEADRFDAVGCVRPEAWADAQIPLSDDHLTLAQRPSDQAAAAVAALASYDGRYHGDQITLGVADESLVPYLLQQLDEGGVPARFGPGLPLERTAVFRLLDAVADYLETRDFSPFAALVRHPAMFDYLSRSGCEGDWLSDLDRYYCERLALEIGERWPASDEASALRLTDLYRKVSQLLGGFLRPAQSLETWSPAVADFLTAVFGREPLDESREADRPVLAACTAVGDVFVRMATIPALLRRPCTSAEAVRLILDEAAGALSAPSQRGAVELLGWLELPLDDAPALIVAGFNEGFVPMSLNADPFLPDALRAALGIDDNRRRYARDAYALSVLVASRERLTLIVGRRDAKGNPLAPSRLLFGCDEPTLVRRATRFFAAGSGATFREGGAIRPGVAKTTLAIPRPPRSADELSSMRVTEFRDYLACPYRYYLKHRLKLETLSDDADELDGAMFGSLAHDVLCDFGGSEAAHSDDPQQIADALFGHLARLARAKFGASPRAAVRVQIEQLRRRLEAFAKWQATWRADGWRIAFVERGTDAMPAMFDVDGVPVALRGRIDRIDRNEATREIALLDYKTGDGAPQPEKSHRRSGQWVDLQLPLYRHMAAAIEGDATLKLGYVLLPKDIAQTGIIFAEWTEADLAEADETARDVVRGIRAQRFWPPTLLDDDRTDLYAAICPEALVRDAVAEAGPIPTPAKRSAPSRATQPASPAGEVASPAGESSSPDPARPRSPRKRGKAS